MELDVIINGEKLEDKLLVSDVKKDVPEFLNGIRIPNHSIIGMFNEKKLELDVLRSEDEYDLLLVSALINENPSILEDNHIFCVSATSCASFIFRTMQLQAKMLKTNKTEDKRMILVKRSNRK